VDANGPFAEHDCTAESYAALCYGAFCLTNVHSVETPVHGLPVTKFNKYLRHTGGGSSLLESAICAKFSSPSLDFTAFHYFSTVGVSSQLTGQHWCEGKSARME
jgi:hypothetical protein